MSSENVIRALSDIEHVRLRSGMYVGQIAPQSKVCWILDDLSNQPKLKWSDVSYSAGLVKLFDEVISNSIDEAYRLGSKSADGGAFTIRVDIKSVSGKLQISVEDNGRGIPLKKVEGSEALMADLALCNLRAGSNFDADRAVSIGTHGLGVTLVNILSEHFEADINDGLQSYHLECSKGEVQVRKLKIAKGAKPGTKITYIPDRSVFNASFDEDAIKIMRRRIYDLAACFPSISFKLDGHIVQSRSFRKYVNSISSSPLVEIGTDPIIFEYQNLRLAILSSDDNLHISFVNGIETYEGGTHLEYVRNRVIETVATKLSKKHKVDIKPNDIRAKTCFVVMLDGVVDPQFRSQTKEYLASAPGSWTHLIKDFDGEAVAKKMIGSSHICDQIVEAFLLKKEAKERAEVKKLGKDMKKLRVAKHLPANHPNPAERILFLTEGDSAIGQLSNVRDPNIHGGFPLRGKIINSTGMTVAECFDNKEVKELAAVLGIRPGEAIDIRDLEYGKIAIMADADHDGSSIKALLVNLFMNLWPEIVTKGCLWAVEPPSYRWVAGKQTGYLYGQGEADKASAPKGSKLTFLKGLGSMSEQDYAEMIENPRWSKIELDDRAKFSLDVAFGPSADKRKVWLS